MTHLMAIVIQIESRRPFRPQNPRGVICKSLMMCSDSVLMSILFVGVISGEESFESEMKKALDSIQMDSSSPTEPVVTSAIPDSNTSTNGSTLNSHKNSDDRSKDIYLRPQTLETKEQHIQQIPSKSTFDGSVGSNSNNSSFLYPSKPQIEVRTSSLSSAVETNNCPTSAATTVDPKTGRNRGVDCDEVRVMQKVLAKEVSGLSLQKQPFL